MSPDTPITKADLEAFRQTLEESFKRILRKELQAKRTYTPAEYSELKGIPYSTVVSYCSRGLLNARQNRRGGSWIIKGDIEPDSAL